MTVKIKIAKDENMFTYIKMIRSYSKDSSLGKIKKQIENNDAVIVFDSFGYDFNDEFTKGVTEDDYNFGFYKFLENLQKSGAVMTIYIDNEKADMQSLYQHIVFEKEIREDTEKYPD